MSDALLKGLWRFMLPIPSPLWRTQIAKTREKIKRGQAFMSGEHRSVHHFVVRELPRIGEPISPGRISGETGLPRARVKGILDDLEKHLTYLFRNNDGAVVWAYPATVDKTPHHLTFSSGEQIHAA